MQNVFRNRLNRLPAQRGKQLQLSNRFVAQLWMDGRPWLAHTVFSQRSSCSAKIASPLDQPGSLIRSLNSSETVVWATPIADAISICVMPVSRRS